VAVRPQQRIVINRIAPARAALVSRIWGCTLGLVVDRFGADFSWQGRLYLVSARGAVWSTPRRRPRQPRRPRLRHVRRQWWRRTGRHAPHHRTFHAPRQCSNRRPSWSFAEFSAMTALPRPARKITPGGCSNGCKLNLLSSDTSSLQAILSGRTLCCASNTSGLSYPGSQSARSSID
jgi:hypothetical protein